METVMKQVLVALAAIGAIAFGGVRCPIDNMDMYFTGRTGFEMGKMLQEYKCPMGHTTWVVQ